MNTPLQLPRFSLGVGDRFAHEAIAQLQACVMAADAGVAVAPVWNKSNREHTIIGSDPAGTRAAADAAVRQLCWKQPYFVDADHIRLDTYERFLAPSDFFTIDVADRIGQSCAGGEIAAFVGRHPELLGSLQIAGIEEPFQIDRAFLERTAGQFLAAVQQAGTIYRAIAARKGEGNFVTEISMDETGAPQTPPELLVILAAIADERIPVQTIAPRFTGRFNKGVDYEGDVEQFAREFREDLLTLRFAAGRYGLPDNLKLSVHSGSDKFSIYPAIHSAITDLRAGVHVKTAGTTWLEELIGLAESDGDGLDLAKHIYAEAYAHRDELSAPYAEVIQIDASRLPSPADLNAWSSGQFVLALRHDKADPAYNPNLRQLLHIGFKVAAKLGSRYTDALAAHRDAIARNVTENLFARHIRPIFLG